MLNHRVIKFSCNFQNQIYNYKKIIDFFVFLYWTLFTFPYLYLWSDERIFQVTIVNPPSIQFYQSIFMMVISFVQIYKQDLPFIPRNITPYLVRGFVEGLIYVLFYYIIPITPLSLFSILFNSRSVIIFIIEGIYLGKCPRMFHLVLSLLSFLGVLILLGPSLASPSSEDQSNTLVVYGSVMTLIIAVMSCSINIYTKFNGTNVVFKNIN